MLTRPPRITGQHFPRFIIGTWPEEADDCNVGPLNDAWAFRVLCPHYMVRGVDALLPGRCIWYVAPFIGRESVFLMFPRIVGDCEWVCLLRVRENYSVFLFIVTLEFGRH